MDLNSTIARVESELLGAYIKASDNWASIAASAAAILFTTVVVISARAKRHAAVQYTVPIPEQCKPGWDGKVLENPSIRTAGSNDIQCYCPATGKLLGRVKPAAPADVDTAIKKAEVAQEAWAKTTFDDRKKVLRTLMDYILENQDAIAQAACLDSGKTRVDAALGEILVTTEKIKYLIDYGEQALKPEKRPTSFMMVYKKAEVRYEPLGVVCALVSWNYPFHNLLNPILSSIFAGNGVVVKGSENTAWSSEYFIQIVKGALSACGHSPDLVESIMCWPDVAGYLTSHPGIQHITFVGSRPVAHHVAASASKTLVPLCVELGGKDAHIILDDVKNLKALSSVIMRGVFQSASQNCIGIERIIALPKAYEQLIRLLEPRIAKLRVGSALDDDEVDMGAMISCVNFDRLEQLVEDAVSKGARCLVGGRRYIHPKFPKGHYFQPTLLVGVTPEMEIAQNESFAPICVLMPAKDVGDALRIANSANFGLGGSVYGRNKAHIDRVVKEMKCGMVAVNDFAVYYLNQSLPFGGVRGSGYGRFAGPEGLRSVCNPKSVIVDRWPSLISTGIPPIVDYPINKPENSWNFTKGLVEFAYGQGLKAKVAGITKLLGAM